MTIKFCKTIINGSAHTANTAADYPIFFEP